MHVFVATYQEIMRKQNIYGVVLQTEKKLKKTVRCSFFLNSASDNSCNKIKNRLFLKLWAPLNIGIFSDMTGICQI